MIATWRLDLDRILRVFNVGSTSFAWLSLTPFPQTEPATNTHVVVSNIHRNTLKSRAGTSSQNSTVSGTCTRLPQSSYLPLPRLMPGQ